MMKFLVNNQKIEALEREVIASDQIAFVLVKFVCSMGLGKRCTKVVQFTQSVCISFTLNELLSIVENTSLMGDPVSARNQKAIDVLQTKIGRTEETTDKEDK